MTERKLIFIASPYAGDIKKNIEFARAACRFCIEQGHTPFAPHLLYPQMLNDNDPAEREIGLKLGHHVMEKCDEFWLCGDMVSSGMQGDFEKAVGLDLPILNVSRAQILDAPDPVYAIWAKGRPGGPLAGQSGFLCENRKRLFFSSATEAEVRIKDIRNLCLNKHPAAELKCLEYPPDYASELRMHLEILKDLDMAYEFDPDIFEIRRRIYGNTGGGCMVGTVEFYLPELDKSVWVNCNDESVTVTSADSVWNEDHSDSWERFEDVCLYSAAFEDNLPEYSEPWLSMIKTTLEYTIEQATACSHARPFSLSVLWAPESILQQTKPEYHEWLREQGKNISIAEEGRIVIDEAYPQSGQFQTGISPMEL